MRTHVATLLLACAMLTNAAADESAFDEVLFPTSDGGTVYANLYGDSQHTVVLAHGAVFDKESWHPLATSLQKAGYRVLAIDFRGYGKSQAGSQRRALELDVLAAVSYLRSEKAQTVSVLGGSMGGGAAARAAVLAEPEDIDGLILLSPASVSDAAKIQAGRIVFIASRGEGFADQLRRAHRQAPEPKELHLLPGSAHAQHIFKTDQADALTQLIIDSLNKTTSARQQ